MWPAQTKVIPYLFDRPHRVANGCVSESARSLIRFHRHSIFPCRHLEFWPIADTSVSRKGRVRNSAAQSVKQLCSLWPESGDGRPSLCGRESTMISPCRKRHQSGSRVLDPRTTTWPFTDPIKCPRLNPTNESYQRLVDKDDCKSSSVSRCDGSKGRFAFCICSEVQRWCGSQGISEHGNKGARRAVA